MPGSDGGGNGREQPAMSSPQRMSSVRSASPAKRSAAVMEDAGAQQTPEPVPGSFSAKQEDDGPTPFDEAMAGMSTASESMHTQDTAASSVVTSADGTETAHSSATSLASEPPPAYTEMDTTPPADMTAYTTEQLDQQVARVVQANAGSLDVGEKGVVVSNKWLARVMSRTSDGLKSSEYPKNAREGPIGPVDNSDIVEQGEFQRAHLSDPHGGDFIPLKPGLSLGNDFSIIPSSVWGDVVALYGLAPGQHQINRYAVDTAPDGSLQTNVQYDTYPPTFTIRRVPFGEQKIEPPVIRTAAEGLKHRTDQRGRGQSSPDDAPKLVASRSDRFQRFLARAKDAAGIPRGTKVKVWRVLNPQTVAVDEPDTRSNGVQSPPPSRSASPGKTTERPATKLLVTAADFKKMDVGSHIEHIDAKDETNNDKYNGKSNLERHGLFEDQTLLLEEMMGGPAGGEFQSDGNKAPPRLALPGPKAESRPGSATPSGRTSPVPGGMLTRGRARKDGKTRGAVGLSNLGNTCYMNSALQCIRSVEELAVYFLAGKYKSEINANNPLGHGGIMAKQYAGVLNGIYGDSSSTAFSPNDFKRTLGRLQPLFSGYGQQDSQEFLSFLVDALHEDLNRIQKKPYFENPDSDDARVLDPAYIAELGEIYRSNHSKRNDSVCMDLFSGFYKNTMECPVCNKYSVTFDPYSLLTVQLPIESTFQHTITYVPLRGRPVNHAIDVDKNSSIKTLKDFIAQKHGKKADQMWMIEVYNHKIYKVFEDQRSLAEESVQANDHLFMYELEAKPTNIPDPSPKKFSTYSYSNYNSGDKSVPGMDSEKADHFAVPIFFRTKGRFGNGFDYALHPLFIMLTRDEAQDFEVIIKKVLIALAQQTSRPILTELEEKDSEDGVTVNGEADASEDSAQVSDRSVPSEDGYVEVVTNKTDGAETDPDAVPIDKGNPVPKRFMHPDFEISETLRNGLFRMNYAKSSEGMLCTGMSSIDANSVRNMYSRVKRPERRGSTPSVSGESSASGATGPADGESEESDADEDTPDLVLGGHQDAMSVSTPPSAQPESDEDALPEDPLTVPQKNFGKGKRRGGGKKRGGRKQKTYGRKDRHNHRNNRSDNTQRIPPTSQRSAASTDDEETNPFYIKLGEAIVLDMQTEGMDALFGGSATDLSEMRGRWLSDDEGKGLPFFPDPALEAKRSLREGRKKNGITLEDCFVETGKREILSEDNAWYCNRCKEMRCAAKTLEIWTAPDILIVHLKRFGGNRSFRDKIDVLVDYPVEGLDLTSRVGCKEEGKSYVYDLFAVDNHYGGLGGGHYTAMAKNFNDGCWYDYNDSMVSKLGNAKVRSAAAYLLFYRRRSDKPLGSPALQDLVTEYRNPSPPSHDTEDVDHETDLGESGEGRLGDPITSLHGSSSASAVAGAAKSSARLRTLGAGVGGGVAGGVGGVGSNPRTKTMGRGLSLDGGGSLGSLNGLPIAGPERPPHLRLASQEGPAWGFEGLDQQAEDAEGQALLGGPEMEVDGEGDVDSMTADHGMAGSDHGSSPFEDRVDDFPDDTPINSSGAAGAATPAGSVEMNEWMQDSHSMYSSAHERLGGGGGVGADDGYPFQEDDVLHLEDAGIVPEDSPTEAGSPEADEIRLGGAMEDEEMAGMTTGVVGGADAGHDKMD